MRATLAGMRGHSLALGACLAAALAAGAGAQAVVRTIELGDGMQASLVALPAGACGAVAPCALWSGAGLDLGGRDALLVARTYARVPGTPRVLAAIPPMPAWALLAWRPWRGAGMLYTDDRGATWHAAGWPSVNAAEAISFTPDGALGVAVGPARGIWISEDRGVRWRERSVGAGLRYVEVAALGRAIVLVDEARAAWISRDRGFSLTSGAEGVSGPLRVEAEAIVIPTERGEVRVDDEGRRVR